MILYNGIVYTEEKFYSAVVVKDSVIKYIGDDDKALSHRESDEEIIDLQGRLVLPGFIDSHAHGGSFTAQGMDKIELYKGGSVEEYVNIIKQYITDNPEKNGYKGVGWQSPLFGEKGPEKEILDNICREKPIVIRSGEGHAIWANSKAIDMAGITEDTISPKGGVVEKTENGKIRGCFKDEAGKLLEGVLEDDSVELYKKAILEYQNIMVSYGYTGAAEMMMNKDSNLHKAYIELAEEDMLIMKAQTSYQVSPSTVKQDLKTLKRRKPFIKNRLVDGYYAKIFIDGVVECATAWLKDPYTNNPGFYGEPLWTDKQLFETCIELDKMGYDIHFHVIGDRAVSQMIDAMEAVKKANGKRDRRPVAAHVQLMDPEDLKRMKSAGISVSANPYWFFKDEVYSVLNEIPLLGERADEQFPFKSLIDVGIIVSCGSDYSITEDPNPVLAMKTGMERVDVNAPADDLQTAQNIAEKATFDDMLKCVTINGAYTMKIENLTGSIEVGKDADMVVLNHNLFNTETSEYKNIKADMTISEGELVYQRI